MIDKESLLNDKVFLKSFKDGLELQSFFRELQARAVSQMLEGEMDGHLGYEKHERSGQGNSRNGHTSKKVRGDQGDLEIQVPRDRDGTFNPIIVPKRKNMIDGVENVIVSLYAKGMSVSDIENMMSDVYGFDLSESTISRITDRVAGDVIAWQNRPLDNVYLIVWMDGIVFKVRENWDELTVSYDFPLEIRRIIYTTNIIENMHGKIRKNTKNRLSFTSNNAVLKYVYLALREISRKWTMPIRNWAIILNQFLTLFENRVQL